MSLARTLERGEFHCPNCRAWHSFQLRRTRPFLTLYFIPVVPLGRRLEFVRCDKCRESFETDVLTVDRREAQLRADSETHREILAATILAASADDELHPREIEALLEVTRRLEIPVGRDELGALCSELDQRRLKPLPYLRSVSPRWSPAKRRLAAQMIFFAATATGGFNEAQAKVLIALPKTLGITDEDYQRAVEEMTG